MPNFSIRALDANGDWLWGNNRSDVLTGEPAVEENLQTRLLCFLNDAFWAMNEGVDWFNLLGETNPAAETGILLQTRQVIANSYGVTAINSVQAVENAGTRAISVLYNLSTIFNPNFAGEVQPTGG